MKRTTLKSKEVNKQLIHFNVNLSKKDIVELVEDKYKILFINKLPCFFYYEINLIPTLKYLQDHIILKKITVDMGAVKFVINGADIMRPGITKIEDGISKGDFVVIVDENNQKPLAIGKALFFSSEMKLMDKGKAIKLIHYVGDELWKI